MNQNFIHSKFQRDTFKKCAFNVWKEIFNEKQLKRLKSLSFRKILELDSTILDGIMNGNKNKAYASFRLTYMHHIIHNNNLLRAVRILEGNHFHVDQGWRNRATSLLDAYLCGERNLSPKQTKILDGLAYPYDKIELTVIHGPKETVLEIAEKVYKLFWLESISFYPHTQPQVQVIVFRFSPQEQRIIKSHLKKYKDIKTYFGKTLD